MRPGTLTVVTSADAEPFEYWKDDQIVGFDSALAQELASRLGLEIVIENAQFNEIKKAMESGRTYDVAIASFSIPSEQPEGVAFSEAYFYGDNALIVRSDSVFSDEEAQASDGLEAGKTENGETQTVQGVDVQDSNAGNSDVEKQTTEESVGKKPDGLVADTQGKTETDTFVTLDSLKERRIASVAGYSQVQYAKETFSEDVIEYSSAQACLAALEAGEVDAVVLEYYQAKVQIANYPALEIFARIASTDSYGVMVNSKNAELLEDINEAIQAMKKDGTLSRLENEYLR